jgi:biopolymer transport protein ExbD
MYDLTRNRRKEGIDLNVVPILDMLISVIFFLLLATSFMQLTKESVPPSSVSTITDPVAPPPLSARLICVEKGNVTRLILSWIGATPGQVSKELELKDGNSDEARASLLTTVTQMVEDFSVKYPKEKTLQVGMGAKVPYQKLVTIMDAAKEKLPDVVLFDYSEAEQRAEKSEATP